MAIGQYRERVTIQSEMQTPDGAGGYTLGWSSGTNVWAQITPVTGREIYASGHLEARVTHQILMRYMMGVTTAQRLLYGTRTFKIHAVINVDERDQTLKLLVEEGGPT